MAFGWILLSKNPQFLFKNVHKNILPQILPLDHKKKNPQVILETNKLPKRKTHMAHYPITPSWSSMYIYCKGSNKTACATVLNKTIHKKALPMKGSIFTAEVCTIDFSLYIISKNKHNEFIIFSDWLSVLTSLRNKKLENPLIVQTAE